ncbi:hypothetical protein C8J57DRAFT_1530119 [Mycena rebaudengoi]|nr:hypothetical protein C8J57DRAFT_1530119 [Mycena rebaudengoi]
MTRSILWIAFFASCPKNIPTFKALSHDFSEAIFIRDESDVLDVQAVLKQHGIDWKYAKRAHAPALNRCIRRVLPDRKSLLQRLKTLFAAYADIQCSTKRCRGSFFSDEAKEMTQHLLDTVQKGYFSDPSGISLYFLMGKDCDGLNIYRTVGFHNRTGQKYQGHYDIWIRDEIVELAIAAETAQHPLVQNTYLKLTHYLRTSAPRAPAPARPKTRPASAVLPSPHTVSRQRSMRATPSNGPTAQTQQPTQPTQPSCRVAATSRQPTTTAGFWRATLYANRSLQHTEHPISRRHHHGPHVTTTIEDANAVTLDISPSYHPRSILGSGQQLRFLRAFLATPPSPPLSALLDHLIRVPNDRRPRAILQHTFQLKIWDPARPPFRQSRATRAQPYPASQRAVLPSLVVVAGWTSLGISIEGNGGVLGIYGARRSMTPLFPGSKQLATSHLRVVTFIIVMCRAETSTDPMFGLYDLKNAGPPTASAVPPLDLPRREPRDSPFRGRDRRGGSDLAGAL